MITRPVVIREMAPINQEKMLEMQQNLSRLMAHMNEAPLVPAVAAAGGAAEQSTTTQDASRQEIAKPMKCTIQKFTSSKTGVELPKEGYSRIWHIEPFGWSYIDWEQSEFELKQKEFFDRFK